MITDKITLEKLLQRMYWIETEMEQLGTWEARIEMMEDNVAALEVLSHDSDKHGNIVQKWLIIGDITVPETAPSGLPKHIFDFEGMTSNEMFERILKYEILAKNAYEDIKNANLDVITELFPNENDQTEFMQDIEQLIKDEEKHANICKSKIGGFAKIML
ncbi:hypothetical protein [Methanolobus psychrotolerans]|uniref:hypothetical protein n=1 Tax=Methanolobus psychrotolerans TaxID=1874706 RepID=UPI001F5CE674|nr:hypothetical protein [Methanolobus psychrotolerans]